MPTEHPYPPVSFQFSVDFSGAGGSIDGKEAGFQEVSGFNQELGVEEVVEGGENRFTHRLPSRAKFSNLVLKRGALLDSKVIKWIQNAIDDFVFDPQDIRVYLLDEAGKHLVKWTFVKAYPVKWSTSDLKAQDNALLIETLELAYQYFKREKP